MVPSGVPASSRSSSSSALAVQRRPLKLALVLAISLVAAAAVFFGSRWLLDFIRSYIRPKTITQRSDLVSIFVLIAAGAIGFLTAIAALTNAFFTRSNVENAREALRQQRDLDERRAQDDALQAYYGQMGDLLTMHKLAESKEVNDPIRLLARAQTSTLLERLGSESSSAQRKKGELIHFLYHAGLINRGNTIVALPGVDLSGAYLRNANLQHAYLPDADLTRAYLRDTSLRSAYLGRANLSGADLSGADLSDATVTEEQLFSCETLEDAT